MVKNNQSANSRRKLDALLRAENIPGACSILQRVLDYARFLADIENVIVVVSDMAAGESHIFAGAFANSLGITDYNQEKSIWENKILSLMSPEEQEEKYIAELRFFHYLRHIPQKHKKYFYLVSKLRFKFFNGELHDVLHRMHYIFDEKNDDVRYAICIYGPMTFDFNGKSHAVNSVTGLTEELTATGNGAILSPRESQVLSLIDKGMKSAEIAERLSISVHTVSRHRQEIISKLQVKNSHDACRVARTLKII